jgi:hypothetical protein
MAVLDLRDQLEIELAWRYPTIADRKQFLASDFSRLPTSSRVIVRRIFHDLDADDLAHLEAPALSREGDRDAA